MHEFHRQQYLEAMGLTVLTPSFILPDAKASQPFDYLDVDAKQTASSAVDIVPSDIVPSITDDTPSSVNDNQVVTPSSPEAALKEIATPEPLNPSVSHAVEQILEKAPEIKSDGVESQPGIGNQPFTLAVLFIDGQYMVIDEVPQGQVFSLHQEQFYKELLYAMGMGTRTYHREMFTWPLKTKPNTNNPVLNVPNAAQDLFDGYLRANWPQQQAQKAVFCLGEHSVKLWDNSTFAQQCQDDNEALSLFVSGISSFTAMMDWTKKPVLWEQLQKQLQQQTQLSRQPS